MHLIIPLIGSCIANVVLLGLFLNQRDTTNAVRKELLTVGDDRAETMSSDDEKGLQLATLGRECEALRETIRELEADKKELGELTIKQALMLTPLMYSRLLPEIRALAN